jgi:GNAT superfamily N-acetyltransferase
MRLDGRDAVLAAAGHHPYVRLNTDGDAEVTGYAGEGVTVWVTRDHRGPVPSAIGDAARAAGALTTLASEGRLDGARRWHLPRLGPGRPIPVTRRDDWDFLSTRTAPPPLPGEDAVEPVRDEAAVEALLTAAFPTAFSRPGDPRVRAWWGVREGRRLIAVGAERGRAGVGMLASIAVAPDRRGRGLGAALTAAMTRHRLAVDDVVALGVMTDNAGAARLYRRLGFGEPLPRSSVEVALL